MNMKMFVYGTLKRGFGNNRLLEGSEYVGPAKINGTMYSFGGFPAVTLRGNGEVHGEIYNVDSKEVLERIDRLEGHPDWYERQEVATTEGPAWVYLMPDSACAGRDVVESGVW